MGACGNIYIFIYIYKQPDSFTLCCETEGGPESNLEQPFHLLLLELKKCFRREPVSSAVA